MVIRVKYSANSGNVPVALSNGELALNNTDQLLYYRHANGSIIPLANGQLIGIGTDQFARDRANVASVVAKLSSNVSQLPANTSPYAVTFNVQDLLIGASQVSGNSVITVAANGTYSVVVSGHIMKTGTGSGSNFVDVWLRKNGVDVDGAYRNTIEAKNNFRPIFLTTVLTLQANDTLQVMQAISTAGISLGLTSGISSGGPYIPSATIVITRFYN